MKINRRQLGVGIGGAAIAALSARSFAEMPVGGASEVPGYGALVKDPNALLDLPEGFSYRVLSRLGNVMSDGNVVPNAADGMGCIDLGDGKVALVRNHELRPSQIREGALREEPKAGFQSYDSHAERGYPLPGGTTTLIYNTKTGVMEKEWLSLMGTIRNCSGGITPWGSWLSCEESTNVAGDEGNKDHGYVFEVPIDPIAMADPVPLKAMGRFNHEAVCVDPRTGIVYLTEDKNDSLFYRFIPNVKGKLSEGGKLQALAFKSRKSVDTRNWEYEAVKLGDEHEATWIDLDDVESPKDDLRVRGNAAGAAIFARGEGVIWDGDQLYFASTSGGKVKYGQIFRYTPNADDDGSDPTVRSGTLSLFLESNDPAFYNYGDNLCVMPNGHLMVCEDQYTAIVNNHLRGVNKEGKTYIFGRSQVQTEFAGACFSPDGQTMFVNLYAPTYTFAITGPWDSVRA